MKTSAGRTGIFVSNAGILLVCLLAAGCAPIWPSMMTDRELSYGSGAGLNCHQKLASSQAAFDCLSAAREELQRGMIDIGRYDRTLGYTTVAGGTAAGYQLAKISGPNMAVLRGLGIALAAVVGFDKVVGADKQHQVLDAGSKALLCIDQAARGAQTADTNLQTEATEHRGLFAVHGMNMSSAGARITDQNHRTYIQQRLTTQQSALAGIRNELLRATQAAAEDGTLAERIRVAVVRIRSEVLAQLTSNRVDLKELFKEQQQRVGDIVGEIVSKAQKAQSATNTINVLLAAAEEETQGSSAEAVKPATDAFDTCVATLPR